MTKVRIIGCIDDTMLEKLIELLNDADCEIVDKLEDETVDEKFGLEQIHVGESRAEDEFDSLNICSVAEILVLSPECLADESLSEIMRRAATRGCHVVGIWPRGSYKNTLPQSFDDYGGDTVVWDATSLKTALSQPVAKPTWTLPDDRPRSEPPLKRHKC